MSIENQGIMLRRYAEEHGFEVVDEYADDGYSGTDFDRPEVKRLLNDARSGKIDTVIVKDLSRFGRNYIEVGQYVDYIFPAYGIRFIAINDNVDTAERNGAAMDMMPIMNVFNEWHAANTSKKIRAVLDSNRRRGKCTSWSYPYGYKAGGDENRTAIIDPEAAEVVGRIFAMRAEGVSAKTVAKTLTDEGIPNPATHYTRLDGKKIDREFSSAWSARTVMWILKNPIYIGRLEQRKTTSISYKNHKIISVPEEERIVKENAHEAIVSREIWERAQAVNGSSARGRRDKNDRVHTLSGLLVCGDCGKKLKLKSGKNRNYYVCRTYADLGKKYCSAHRICEKTLEEIVLADIKSMIEPFALDEEKEKEFFGKERAKRNEKAGFSREKRLRFCRNRVAELDKLMRSAFEERVLGNLPEEVFSSFMENYRKEKLSIEAEMEKIEKNFVESDFDDGGATEYVAKLKRCLNCPKLSRELCLNLIDCIIIAGENGEKLHIRYKTAEPESR